MSKSILIIAPHGDDEVLGTGGAIQYHVSRGDKVVVAFVRNADTARESQQLNTTTVSSQFLTFNAMYLDLPKDEIIESYELTTVFDELFNSLKPDRLYCPWYGDMHQEHRVISRTCGAACRRGTQSNHFIKQVLFYEVPSSTDQGFYKFDFPFQPTFYIKLTQTMISNKCTGMSVYKNEQSILRDGAAIIDLAKRRGREAGCEYAEGFVIARYVNE